MGISGVDMIVTSCLTPVLSTIPDAQTFSRLILREEAVINLRNDVACDEPAIIVALVDASRVRTTFV